jgi:hypothetical protein
VVASTAPLRTIARRAGLFKLFGHRATVVDESARLYNCARCHCQVVICRRCDRGNIYCPECAPVAARESRGRAGAAYQRTDRGRANHAARQRLYLLGLEREKMTHKGPQGGSARSPCALETAEGRPSASAKEACDVHSNPNPSPATTHDGAANTDGDSTPCCNFCGQCSAFLRTEKLRHATAPARPAARDRAVPLPRPRLVRARDRHAPRSVPRGRPASAPARAPPVRSRW